MKKLSGCKLWILVALLLAMPVLVFAEQQMIPYKSHAGKVGTESRYWAGMAADKFTFPEISAPSGNPSTNTGWLYVKDNGGGTTKLYFEDSAGTVTSILDAAAQA